MISSPFVLLVIGLGGLVALGSALVAGREFHTAYRVFSTPTGRVSDLLTDSGGVIELHGTGRSADRTLSGPVTGEACFVCETVVEEYESGQYGGSWNEIDSAVQSVPFLLADDSGSVLVDPRMADVRLVANTERIEVDGGSAPPERVQAYIEDNTRVSSENSRLDLGPFSLPMVRIAATSNDGSDRAARCTSSEKRDPNRDGRAASTPWSGTGPTPRS